MNRDIEEEMMDDYINKIQLLASLALNGEQVESSIDTVVSEACYFLFLFRRCDVPANLLAFKSRLQKLAKSTHKYLPAYKRPLIYAARLVAVPHPKQGKLSD